MIFPALGPQYYDERDKGILSRMEAFYSESITINQSFWGEADTDTRFMAGDQTLWNDIYGNLPANRRRQFNFNRIARVINMIDGHQRNNRKSTVVVGVENADNDTADQFTKVLMWVNQQEGVLETISDSFRGSLITGMNLLQVWMDYRSDPVSGNIKVDNCSYNSFLIDPFFKKKDLSDCNAIWKRSYLTKRECISLLPESAEMIASLEPLSNRDGKFQFMPETYNYGMRNLLTYDEYYYRDYRNQKLLVDAETGETQEWKSQDEEKLKEFLRTYPQVTVIESEIPTVKLAIVVQGKVMYDGPQPMGIDMYPFVPTIAYHFPELPYFPWRWQGVVRGLRDSQYLYNRRKAIELDILESQINSGWIYKESALVNPKDVFLSGQGRGLALKDDAQITDVQQILPPQIPPSMIELSKILGQEISEISGVNEELLGSATDDKAGILSMLRQGAGMTTLQILFDNLDYAQKMLGKIMINLIQANFTPGKVKKILEGKEPTEQFYNKAFGKYDANVEEGLNTTTQKQMQFAQLLNLREVGVPVPDEMLLQASTMQNKNELIESIEQAKQEEIEAQQQQQESAMELQAAQTNLANARAAADQGLGLERISRVEENQALAVERRAQAQHDMDAGLLDKVKALKELETLDIVHLEKLIALSHMLREDVVETPGEKNKNMVENNAADQLSQSPNLDITASQQPPQSQAI
jgi:hypothetical protein